MSAVAVPPTAGDGVEVDRPTIVLVHGAWAGPSCWDHVAIQLERDGFRTTAPVLDEARLNGDTAAIRTTLDAIPGKKVLVGHAYGGMVISNAGHGRSDVLALVYTAGLVPDERETAFRILAGHRNTGVTAHLVIDANQFVSIDAAYFSRIVCQDLDADEAARLNAGQRPIHLVALNEPSGPVGWRSLPSWYAISGDDRVIDQEVQASMAERAGSKTVRFEDASHAGGFTRYAARLVELIEQAVAATAV